jgi:hypothetical protein
VATRCSGERQSVAAEAEFDPTAEILLIQTSALRTITSAGSKLNAGGSVLRRQPGQLGISGNREHKKSYMNPIRPTPAAYHTDDSYWHLLTVEDGSVYVLVNCEASFVSYDTLVKLNYEELRDYHGLGWLSIQHLANRINYFVDDYKGRRITGPLLEAAIQASKH